MRLNSKNTSILRSLLSKMAKNTGILSRMASFLGNIFDIRSRAEYISDWLSGIDTSFSSYTGETVTQASALGLSAVYRCVNVLSDDLSKLPIHLYKKSSNSDREQDENHPANRLLSIAPNSVMTPITFMKLMEVKRELWGNAYAYIDLDINGYPESLIPIPPEYVTYYLDGNSNIWYIVTLPGYEERKVPANQMIHLKGFSTDGVNGHSILTYASNTIGAGQAEQKFEGYFYQKGMKLGGVLEVPTKLDPELKDRVRTEFERVTSGLDNMHRIAILDLGQKFTPYTMPLQDAQFVETKQLNIRDVARFFGVPLYKLQEGKEAYSSNEMQDIDYMKNTLDPILVQYEQELRLKLLAQKEQVKRYFKFNRAAQLRADLKTRAAYLKEMVTTGIYTIAEARSYEEMNRYEPGSENPSEHLLVSLNYTPIEKLGEVDAIQDNTSSSNTEYKGGEII